MPIEIINYSCMKVTWNCWHGCHKKSEGCMHCYMYRFDELSGRDSNIVYKTKSFSLPVKKDRKGNYKYPSGTMFYTCFSSDFFLKEADEWRKDALEIIRERSDCTFYLITKRPERIAECMDVEDYPNLKIACTMENQKRFNERAPIYLRLPLQEKEIMIEPMLEDVDLREYISLIDRVSVGGESGDQARTLDFEWVKHVRKQCLENGVDFHFHQTGEKLLVNGKLYTIERRFQHSQAAKAFRKEKDLRP